MTRTHTVWFDTESLIPLAEAIDLLVEDGESRMPYMTAIDQGRLQTRLDGLRAAYRLLAEPVP